MIRSFRGKMAQLLFEREPPKGLPENLHRVTQRKLQMIHAASELNDLKVPPGNHLEKLSGDRKGQYSIRINDQWRICFVWKESAAHDVEVVDYHK